MVYPTGPHNYAGGFSFQENQCRMGDQFAPVVDHGCLVFIVFGCYLLCPDGTVVKDNGKITFDMDYCKGCGVCAYECPKDAIKMVKEQV